MKKYTTYIAVSKDGYIADANGSTEFLHQLNIQGDCGYKDYYQSVNTLVYGSITYDFIKSCDLTSWPYKGKKQFILTSRLYSYKNDDINFFNGSIKELDKKISDGKIWVMGGANVLNQYIEANLIKEMIISYADIELKSGTKLFKDPLILKRFKEVKKENYGDITNITYCLI